MFCPLCGGSNPSEARYCHLCGGDLQMPVPCPSCGELNLDSARFCHTCGTDVWIETNSPSAPNIEVTAAAEAAPAEQAPAEQALASTGALTPCAVCGQQNPIGARFCHRCATELAIQVAETVIVPESTPGEMAPSSGQEDPEERSDPSPKPEPMPPSKSGRRRERSAGQGRRARRRVGAIAMWLVVTASGATIALEAGVGAQQPPSLNSPGLAQGVHAP